MLKFLVSKKGQENPGWSLRNAHLLGADQSAVRADIAYHDGMVVCQKRELGAAALALQWPVGDCGELTIQTCLLPERDDPYLLSLELARHRLMLLYNKMEDWGMFDLPASSPVSRRMEKARKLFIDALCLQVSDPAAAMDLADDALVAAVDGSEELALAHAERLLSRRKETNAVPRHPVGCGVALDQVHERLRAGIASNFDFVSLPLPWRQLAPAESEYRWTLTDSWADWAGRSRLPVVAGPVISFAPSVLPDWVYIWEHDYDQIRDLLYEHIERVVTRYRNRVSAWNVISGLHVNNHFTFNFEQLLDLTRMSTMLVKKIQPNARVIVEITQPFGEYYAANQRSIPPLMYADLLIQSAINFDAFGIRLVMGQAASGQHVRDLMQISDMLDQFSHFGKGVHLVAASPSEQITEMMIASPDPNKPVDPVCGHWRRPWNPQVQGHWAEAVMSIAMSKPYVESVAWQEMIDHPDAELPLSGLVTEDLQPKSSLKRMVAFRRSLSQPTPMSVTMPKDPSVEDAPNGNAVDLGADADPSAQAG